MMKLLISFSFMLLYFPLYFQAQSSLLSGKIIDEETGAPLRNVEVTLLLDITKIQYTSDQGVFSFKLSEYNFNPSYVTTFPLHIYKEGYDYIVKDFANSNGRAIDIVKLKKGTRKGFFINATDVETKQHIGGLSIFIPDSNKSIQTNEFGNAFIEVPKGTGEYDPIQIICKFPFRYHDRVFTTNLKEVRRYKNIALQPIDVDYKRSCSDFVERLENYANQRQPDDEERFIELFEFYGFLVNQNGLSAKDKERQSDLMKIKVWMNDIMNSYLSAQSDKRLINQHDKILRSFDAKYSALVLNKKQSASSLPPKIDDLIDLGVELLKIEKGLLISTKQKVMTSHIMTTIDALKNLIKQERTWQHAVEQKMRTQSEPLRSRYLSLIETYRESIENNQIKVENAIKD